MKRKEPTKLDKERGSRIAFVREHILRKTQEQLGADLGVDRQAVTNWEGGGGILFKNALKIADLSNVPAEWITHGRGQAPAETTDSNGEKTTIPAHGIRELDSDAGLGGGQIPEDVYEFKNGEGMQPTDSFRSESWVFPKRFMNGSLGADANKIIAISTRGDSMSPTINNGDVVFIDTSKRKVGAGTLHAVRDLYGDIIVKRLEIFRSDDDFRINIISDNKAIAPRSEPASEITVVGRVCGIFKLA